MTQNWTVESGLSSGGFTVELRSYAWPSPNEFILEEADPTLGLYLGRHLFGESRPRIHGYRARFRKIGRVTLSPAGVPYDVRGSGGEASVIAFRIASDVFERLTQGMCWDESRLSACADVHGTSIEATLKRLTNEITSPRFGSDIMLEAAGTMIAIELARFFQSAVVVDLPKARQLSTRQIARISELIEENQALSLEKIARECGVSERTLVRNFKATTGRTITEVVGEARMHRAMVLLEDKALPLKVIAGRVGFSNQSSFITAFRRATGLTPGTFRTELASGLRPTLRIPQSR
jgi:AraC family transcriptional regulator